MNQKLISKKKQPFPVTPRLQAYLDTHNRSVDIPVAYEDLLRFEGSVAILDEEGRDTLWVDCLYSNACLLYTSPSPRDATLSRMPSSA